MSSTTQNVADQPWAVNGSVFSIGTSIANKAAAWREALRVWRACRRDVARLGVMDERMLRDIGLTRSEIGHAVCFGRYAG